MIVAINILHVTLCLEIGGLETIIVEMCKRLVSKEKYNVQILCLNRYDDKYKQHLKEYGIKVDLLKKKSGKDFYFYLRFIKYLKQNRIDIVHAHSGCLFDSSICSYFAKTKRVVFSAHGMPLQTGLKTMVEDRVAVSLLDKYIAVSDEICEFSKKRFPSQKRKIKTIINGVNTDLFIAKNSKEDIIHTKEKFKIPEDSFVVGSVGRLEAIKNYQCLVKAFSKVVKETKKHLHLVLVGEGDEKSYLEKIAIEEGTDANVSFLGMQYAIHNILPIFDIFILSSFTEGTSVSLLEAQSCGVPAVVTNVGGNSNIITNGNNGYLCKVDDTVDLAKKIKLLVENDDLTTKMRERARAEILEKFSLTSMVKQYENIYNNLNHKN